MLLILNCPLIAEDKLEVPEIIEIQANEKIVIDGELNKAIWQRDLVDQVVQRNPAEGGEPTQKFLFLQSHFL
jgi:hypothetical protein